MRAFIAIEFDNDIKTALFETGRQLHNRAVKGNFTKLQNLHLTMRFIGEVEQSQLNRLYSVVDNALIGSSNFTLNTDSLGRFAKGSKDIVWLGLKHEQLLDFLYENIENNLIKEGFIKDKENYSAHITLAREVLWVESFNVSALDIVPPVLSIAVTGISVMESARIDGKLAYIRRHFSPFGA